MLRNNHVKPQIPEVFTAELSDTDDLHLCNICKKIFPNKEILIQHLYSHESKSTDDERESNDYIDENSSDNDEG